MPDKFVEHILLDNATGDSNDNNSRGANEPESDAATSIDNDAGKEKTSEPEASGTKSRAV